MSRFLAPIHFWLFNKIKLSEDLEKDLKELYLNKFGEDINTIYNNIEASIGVPTLAMPLDQIIDNSNIHGWLQDKISKTEKRLAALITNTNNKFGKEAISIAKDAFINQGARCGIEANNNYELPSPSEMFKALNNYVLEGMPCDNANSIYKDSPYEIEWRNEKCLHKTYWDVVQGDINLFYELRYAWVDSFVKNANNNYEYVREIEEIHGNKIFINKIIKKEQ